MIITLNPEFKSDAIFKSLLEHGANASILNNEQETPLMIAVKNGNLEY